MGISVAAGPPTSIPVNDSTGAPIAGAKMEIGSISGPASYAAGGFTLVPGTTFTSLLVVELTLEVDGGAQPGIVIVATRNSPANGEAQLVAKRVSYQKASAIGSVIGEPAGVTVQTVNNASTGSESSNHQHDTTITVDSMRTDNPANINPTAGVGGVCAGPAALSLPVLAVTYTSGNEKTTHSHQDNNLYDHQHPITLGGTMFDYGEMPATRDLSGYTWRYLLIGT